MRVAVSEKSGVTILRLQGSLLSAADGEPIRKAVLEAVEDGLPNVLVDLSGVGLLNSVGLSILATNHVTLRCNQGTLKVLAPSPALRRILDETSLTGVFGVFDDEGSALESFR
jgi:anti-anti-sigma factor